LLPVDALNALALPFLRWKRWRNLANQVGKRYQCTVCNTEMIVTKGGDGALACCGQPMQQKQW